LKAWGSVAQGTASDTKKKWQEQSAELRRAIGMQMQAPWTGRPAVVLQGLQRSPRMLDLIDIAYHMATKHAMSPVEKFAAVQNLVVDVSQGLKFKPWHFDKLPCLTTSTTCYLFGRDRLLTEAEKFKVLGFPDVVLSGLSKSATKDLIGDAMAVYSIGLVASAMILVLQFPGVFARPA